MSLCDRCYNPGQCCKRMAVTGGKETAAHKAMRGPAATRRQARRYAVENGLPMFKPTGEPDITPEGVRWRFSCSALTREGRCSIYLDRPDLCRRYEAGKDDLCVHSHGTEAGDPTADVHPCYWALPVLEDPNAPWLVFSNDRKLVE